MPPPSSKDLHKHRLTKQEYINAVKRFTGKHLEQLSHVPPNLVFAGSSGFFAACLTAYAKHLPLRLSPDDIWQVILHAFTTHVDLHHEELRQNFVKHEGKKTLKVITSADFSHGDGDLDQAAPPESWEQQIFPDFSRQIKANTVGTVHDTVATPFSTSTVSAVAAHEITLMSSMRHYFQYLMETNCGIPSITLAGKLKDWVDIRSRAEQLGELMQPSFREKWMPILLPILDEFVRAYSGHASTKFWQSMINIRDEERVEEEEGCYYMSYAPEFTYPYTYYTGWITNLFPYLHKNKINEALQPWERMVSQGGGHDPRADIPNIMSTAPVQWDYFGDELKIEFHAGFVGFTQDDDGTLSPTLGWAVTNEPPQKDGKNKHRVYSYYGYYDQQK